MAIFDYRGQDGREVIAEAYQLAAYSSVVPLESSFAETFIDLIIHDPSPEASVLPDGWRELTPEELGVSPDNIREGGFFGFGNTPYYADDGTLVDGEAKVLAKTDASGNVTNVAISFAATNSIGSVLDFQALSDLSYDDSFDYLFEAVRDYSVDNGLDGSDVLITGYSLGGGATNLAALDRETRLDGFFADSDYIGFASPAIAEGENVFNFGFENDVVYRIGGNDFENPPSLTEVLLSTNQDIESESSLDNLVLFNDSYANPLFPFGPFGLLNLTGWLAHVDGAVAGPRIFDTIATSYFYEEMERDSTIVVSNLSDLTRGFTWVEPVNRSTGSHNNDDAFILGSKDSDLLRGDNGDDHIDGFGGNDTINGRGGDDVIFGAGGNDKLTGGYGRDTFVFTEGFGDDTITDFDTSEDIIQIDSDIFSDFNDLMANAEDTGGWFWWDDEVTITADNGSITLDNVELNELSADNFIFV